jgi:hypothetical protein
MRISGTARAVAAAAALTLTALVTTGATAGPAHAGADSRATDPLVGAPAVGTCSTLTPKGSGSAVDHSPDVSCAKSHTAEVAGVVKLPTSMSWASASPADLFHVVAQKCATKVDTALGRNTAVRDSSAYSYVWFMPTKGQRDKGARWLSCSVILHRAAALAPLPTSTSPFLPKGALPGGVARCLTRSALTTTCKSTHAWRATGTFEVTGRYPGARALNKKANRACVSRVHSPAFRWTYKDKTTWNVHGDHVVVCYSKTTR